MTLVEFILARYDYIAQVARAASPGPWSPDADGHEVQAADGVTVAEGFALSGPQLRATVEHIALNDPEWVLADIAAKRRITSGPNSGTGPESHDEWYETLRLLALPFAAHPDYDPSWRLS